MLQQRALKVPVCLPQFADIHRYFDKGSGTESVVKLMPGDYYITHYNELLTTVLGSCIAVCAYDPVAKLGGMNHFLLPDSDSRSKGGVGNQCTRYGGFAMEQLINDLMRNGAERSRIRFKLFGGAEITGIVSTVGQQNIRFITEFLRTEGYRWEAEDLGSTYPRLVHFNPLTGKAQVKYLPISESASICKQEEQAKAKCKSDLGSDDGGDLELF